MAANAAPFTVLSAADLYREILSAVDPSVPILDIPSGPVPYSGGRVGPTLAVDIATFDVKGPNLRFGPHDTYLQGEFTQDNVTPFVNEHIVDKGSGGAIVCVKGCNLSLSVAEYYVTLLKKGVRGLDLLLVPCCMVGEQTWGGTLEEGEKEARSKVTSLEGVATHVSLLTPPWLVTVTFSLLSLSHHSG